MRLSNLRDDPVYDVRAQAADGLPTAGRPPTLKIAEERDHRSVTKVRVGIVDDDADIRFLVRAWIRADSRLEICCEAPDGQGAIDMAVRDHPDVMILDVMMPGMSGLDAARHVRAQSPETKIVLFTAFPVTDAALTGVDAIVSKGEGRDPLLAALMPTADDVTATDVGS